MKKTPVKLGGAFALAMAILLSLILALPAVGNVDLLKGYGGYGPQTGTIIINKTTTPDGGTGFGFTDNIVSPNSFTLDDGQSQTFLDVPAGTYTVTEDDPSPSYALTGIVCIDPSSGSSVDLTSRTATIDLDAGEICECTFKNTEESPGIGNITVVKEAPGGGTKLFHFGGDLGLMALADGYTGTQYGIPAGDYTIWEDVPDDWKLADVTCSGSGSVANCTPNSGTPGMTVHLAAGDHTVVTFTNSAAEDLDINVVLYNDEAGDGIDEGDKLGDPHKVEVSGIGQFTTGDTITSIQSGDTVNYRLRRGGVVGPWQQRTFNAGDTAWELEFATISVALYNDEAGDGLGQEDLLDDPHKVEVSNVGQFVTNDTFHIPPGANISYRLRRGGVVGPWQAAQFDAGDFVWQLEFATVSVVLYNDEAADGIDQGDLLADPHRVEVSNVAQFVTGDTFHLPPGTDINFRLRRGGVVGDWQQRTFDAGDYTWELEFATVSVVLYNDEAGDGLGQEDLLDDPHKVEVSNVGQFVTGDSFHVPPGANINFRLRRGGVVGPWQATQFDAGDYEWQLEFATVLVDLCQEDTTLQVEVSNVGTFSSGDTMHVPPDTNISYRLVRGAIVGAWSATQFSAGDTNWNVIDDCANLSSIEVIKTASPDTVDPSETGREVEFAFTINNLSTSNTVTINSLMDSVFGDLNGQGTCTCPQTIPAGNSYSCSMTATIYGNPEDKHTNIATACGVDDDGIPVSDDDDATVIFSD